MSRVLLMEDDVELAMELATELQDIGHDVALARSGSEARAELWHWDFDLLITDIIVRRGGRPVPDGGLGLISWVRHTTISTPGLKYLPIIAISAEQTRAGMGFILPTADRVGADRVFEKPVSIDALQEAIEMLTQTDPSGNGDKTDPPSAS